MLYPVVIRYRILIVHIAPSADDPTLEKHRFGKGGFTRAATSKEGNIFDLIGLIYLHGKTFKKVNKRVSVKNVFRSEEHTSELQSRPHLVCRLLLEKKK